MKTYTAYFICLLFLSFVGNSYAQTDSISFVKQKWKEKKIKKGIVWKNTHFIDLFKSEQEINIIEIDLKKHTKKIRLEALPQSREYTSTMAKNKNAIVAINGGFFDMKNGGAVDFIKVNNEVINKTINHSVRANSYLAFDDKKVIITSDKNVEQAYPNVLLAGPYLIDSFKKLNLPKNPFNSNRHPRTAVALKNNKLLLITIDGRNAKAQGMSLIELAQILSWYECSHAMNLDGGGSTAMYIANHPDNGIVNYPSDNNKYDHQGERKVSNIIYLTK